MEGAERGPEGQHSRGQGVAKGPGASAAGFGLGLQEALVQQAAVLSAARDGVRPEEPAARMLVG